MKCIHSGCTISSSDQCNVYTFDGITYSHNICKQQKILKLHRYGQIFFRKWIISIELKLKMHLLIHEHTHVSTYTIKVIYDGQSNWIQIDLEKKCSRFFSNTVPLSLSYKYTIALGNVIGSNNNFTFLRPTTIRSLNSLLYQLRHLRIVINKITVATFYLDILQVYYHI